MRALVTNDDGIDSEGIRALARVALDLELEVTVAAPNWDSSGASASLTAVTDEQGRVVFEERRIDGLEAARCYGVQAAPAFIARMATRGAFGAEPDLILSGVNHGPNTGHAVLHSGTVGAALTASTHGSRALAVSLGVGTGLHVDTAAEVARRVIPWALEAAEPTVLNLNVPNVPLHAVRGLRRAPLASFGAVQTTVTEVGTGYIELAFDEIDPSGEPGSDATLLAEGWATLTALSPVCEASGVDLDDLVDTRPAAAPSA